VNGQWHIASTPRIGRKKNRPGSLAINLEGPYAGCWRDWSDKTSGTFPSLLSRGKGLSFQDAVKAISALPLESPQGQSISNPQKTKQKEPSTHEAEA
jgi:hypothetical protein